MSLSLAFRSSLSLSAPLRSYPSTRRARKLALLPARCLLDDDGKAADGKEEKPESLFMKELRRRGMSGGGGQYGSKEAVEEERGGGRRTKGVAASVEFENGVEGQRERSVALNSEGLEGLIPRAKLLLSIGATFFLSFGPLILVTVASFSALYLYFGPSFIHDGSNVHVSPPMYVDPYELLKDDPIYRVAPPLE